MSPSMSPSKSLSRKEVWSLVHAERRRLIDDLSTVEDTDWETPSLCPGWTVHDVLAHLVDVARIGKVDFLLRMMRVKGDFDLANEEGVRHYRHDNPVQTLEDFRQAVTMTRIPTAHRATRLVEAVVHGEDIRRPLGLSGHYPDSAVHEALSYQLRTPAAIGGSRERTRGCRLIDSATGASWGRGADVTGSGLDLLLAAAGRPVEAGALTGPGADQLAPVNDRD